MNLDGRVALVTGAGTGIGRATAIRLAGAGARVALAGRREEPLRATAAAIETGGTCVVPGDVTRGDDARRMVDGAVRELGGLDILVNAAGILEAGTIESTSLEDWDRMLDVNLRAVVQIIQLALPHLERRPGNIVNVSSVTGTRAFPGILAYCVSKAGVDQLTRCLALELADRGIRVNAVNPGVVVTELHRAGGMGEEQYEAFLERGKSTHPLGRVGRPEEVAELVLFLASDASAWMTGGTLPIDGGRQLTCAR
ncbi:MAG: glucose 1-dehydrogenase [Acidobacteriota bacterium]|jgi:NAD(P)-dependent dehydrogenase (short-subunit alcohol dehydrogenase family)